MFDLKVSLLSTSSTVVNHHSATGESPQPSISGNSEKTRGLVKELEDKHGPVRGLDVFFFF